MLSVQQARHAPAVLIYSRVVTQQFEHFQQRAAAGVVAETAIGVHQLEQQLEGCIVVPVQNLAQSEPISCPLIAGLGREFRLQRGFVRRTGKLAREEQPAAQAADFGLALLVTVRQTERAQCLVSGGAALKLIEMLDIPCRYVENLVLEGLVKIGQAESPGERS